MAKPTGVVDRYDNPNSVREDLTDIIANVDADETPVFSSAKRATATQTYHEWQREELRAANPDNAFVDGDDATATTNPDTQRIGNYVQSFETTWGVSGRAEAVDRAGISSLKARIKKNRTKEVKMDIESRLISQLPAVAGGSGVASKFAGLGRMIYTNAKHNGAGATPAHTSGAATTTVTAGTARALTEGLLLDVAQDCFNDVGKAPPMIVMSAAHKRRAGTFQGISAQRVQTGKNPVTVIAATDAILTDFGLMNFVPHHLMKDATYVLGVDPEYIDIPYLRGWTTHPLGRTGDSERHQMLVDLTVKLRAEKNMFKIADLFVNGATAP